VHRKTFETREQAQLEIFEYIECFYNRLRMHSALGFMSPMEFEEKMTKKGDTENAAIAA
jgi:transposase InsO family protein